MQKKYDKYYKIAFLLMLGLVLTGCVRTDAQGNPSGFFYEYIGIPTSHFLDWLAHIFGGSYGIAIIIVTLITRIFMIPSTLKMTKGSMTSAAKMKVAQPEINEIQAEIEAATSDQEKMQLQQELMAVYKKYDINMLGGVSGCLPLLIQMPIISAVYAAIRSSEAIKNSHFLGINLGERSLGIVIAVVIIGFIQGWLSTKAMPASDNPQAQQTSKSMMLINPLMIGYITYISAAGLGIYFLVGSIFFIFQQLYMNHVVKPKVQAEIDAHAERFKNAPRRKRKPVIQTVNPEDQKERLVPIKGSQAKRRNEGKQKRK
ncbi:membrane protein insertase YidC [Eremococcus coleocola]|uniref:membrane protein insertase YidC n=1 Tax=Eremococcus coleocola TaxID=88132 RepID=UPI000423AC09|nr:membrane protein insertase YidC [Eremococcus coleocola]